MSLLQRWSKLALAPSFTINSVSKKWLLEFNDPNITHLDARRNIAYVLKVIWDNPEHRAALNEEAK